MHNLVIERTMKLIKKDHFSELSLHYFSGYFQILLQRDKEKIIVVVLNYR
jgi:hypothetical protein